MRCFCHPKKESVGICKNCGRGICIECCGDIQQNIPLSCSEFCSNRVQRIDSYTDRAVAVKPGRIYKAVFISQIGLGFFLGLLGIFFVFEMAKTKYFNFTPWVFIGMSIFSFFHAFRYFRFYKKMEKCSKTYVR
ncbi:MAG: hypothetical protein ACTSXG_00800 [Alphaproteobacteria bacterium]